MTNVQATTGYQKPLFLLIRKGPHPVLTSWGSAHPAQPGPIHSNMSQIRVFQLKPPLDFPKDLGHQHTHTGFRALTRPQTSLSSAPPVGFQLAISSLQAPNSTKMIPESSTTNNAIPTHIQLLRIVRLTLSCCMNRRS